MYLGEGKYREATIGAADDVLDADGTTVFDFEQARKAVLAKIEEWRAEAKAATTGGTQTVRTAVEAYVSGINAREDAQDRPHRGAERSLRHHVLSDPIADIGLHALTETILTDWVNRRPGHLKATSKRRAVNDLRAALNAAAKRHRATLPAEIGIIVRHGLAVEAHSEPVARDDAALPDGDIRRILTATAEVDAEEGWEGDLHRMIAVLAATGTRFSQATRLKVGDLQADKGRLMIPVSRKG
ncbi:MAG TPA: integrase, partial [Mesorhizobium sp.]|nr:integrase [Mesorhizobium sp.]